MAKKQALYELVEVPEPFGPVEVVVDDEKFKSFAFAVDDYGKWRLGADPPFRGEIAHPLILANDLLFLFYDKYDGNTARGLHTHERLSFHSPVRRGERVTITGAYVERYEKRGNGYVVLEATAVGDDGRELVRHRGIEIMRAHAGSLVGRNSAGAPPTGRVVRGNVLHGAKPVDRATLDIAPRTPIASRRKHVQQEHMYIFSWGGKGMRNAHTDPQVAAELGLSSTLVQAQQQTTFITEAMTDFFGAWFLTSGELEMRFISPAFVGDQLTVEGCVLGQVSTREGTGLELEVWVRRENGTKTGIGWASAAVR